jgi:TonB family protein
MATSPSTMSDLVSSAIAGRLRDEESLRKSLIVSATAHVLGLALLVVLPQILGLQRQAPNTVMTISLGGVVGPATGGMTPLSGRAVQRAEPKPELPKPEPVRPPAAKPPDMADPSKAVRQTPRPAVATAPKEAPGRTPNTGPEVRKGAGNDPKGAPTNEAGLSTGGAGDNSQVSMGNFCDPQYLGQMISLIHRNWNRGQSVVGMPIVRYIIQRDGTLTDISLRQSSGYTVLDFNAQRAVQATRAIPPLPSCYPNPTFIVNLTFEYTR